MKPSSFVYAAPLIRRWLVALACFVVLPAAAQPLLTPRVAMVVRGRLATSTIGDPSRRAPRDDRALVTVRVAGGAARLSGRGIEARPLGGDVVAVRATLEELRRLAAGDLSSDVVAIEERRVLRLQLDEAIPAVFGPGGRADVPFDGTGVLIGVIDTGVDHRHADLRTADGRTRVAALIDLHQAPDGRHPELPYPGSIWLRDEIDAALMAEAAGEAPAVPVTSRDVVGHGTHVAGIAAGNGLATGAGLPAGRYVGVAPAADLVVAQIRQDDGTLTDVDALEGCRFVLEHATRLGRPVVVNLSISADGGSGDGASNFEMALDGLFPRTAAGRALVVAAGNNGGHATHAWVGNIAGEQTLSLELSEQTSGGDLMIEVWYTGELLLFAESPGGLVVGPVGWGRSIEGDDAGDGAILVENAVERPRADGKRRATLLVSGNGRPVRRGTWRLRMEGTAQRVDAWIVEAPTRFVRFFDHVDYRGVLSIPATAHDVIVVGSMFSRDRWPTLDGGTGGGAVTRGVSAFSAPGPTVDGRFSPDLVAPGDYVLSALSADAPSTSPTSMFASGTTKWLVGDDGVHAAARGTSHAAPFVAGAAALLLQASPGLTLEQIREVLRVTADPGRGTAGHGVLPGSAAAGYSPDRGFGALDVAAAVRHVLGVRGRRVSASRSSVGVSQNVLPAGEGVFLASVVPRDEDGTPLGAGHEVTLTTGVGAPNGSLRDLGQGRYEQAFAAHGRRGDVAHLVATVDGVVLDGQPAVYFADTPNDLLPAGCAAATRLLGGSLAGGLVLVIGAMAWTLGLRRRTLTRTRALR